MATEVENTIQESLEVKEEVKAESDTTGNKENVEQIPTVVSEEVKAKIVKQIEYYFGNYNLPRDKFLKEKTEASDGWVDLETMVKFKRLADLSTDHKVICDALKASELMEVDEAKDSIRRSPDMPVPFYGDDLRAETVKRTIYCKGFPKDGSVTLDKLLEFFKPYNPFENIHMRHYVDRVTKKSGFKGSILIVFPSVEKAKDFVEIDDIQFQGKPLLRKWHQDYLEEKDQEIKERIERKKQRQEKLEKEQEEAASKLTNIDPVPRGAFVFLSGFTAVTSREDVKGALEEFNEDVAFVDMRKGDTECYVRLRNAYTNEELVEKLKDSLKVNDVPITARIVEGEEEEDQLKKAEEARLRASSMRGKKRKFGGGGRGGRGNFKRRRN